MHTALRLLHVPLLKHFACYAIFFKLNIVKFLFNNRFFKSMLRSNMLCAMLFLLLSADRAAAACAFSM